MNIKTYFSGVKLDFLNFDEVVHYIRTNCKTNSEYICLPDIYSISCAYNDSEVKSALNNSILTLPDGKPLSFLAKKRGYTKTETVSGFWLCKNLLTSDCTHFFYGTNQKTLVQIKNKLEEEFPEANILGYKAPPFVELETIKNNSVIEKDLEYIKSFSPDIIWVGISSPKQDILMQYYHKKLDKGIMIGVGGVFDYLSGTISLSPEWIKKLSLRWLYRFLQDPKRLLNKNRSNFKFLLSLTLSKLISTLRQRY